MRAIIIGTSASGKTTLGRELSKITESPSYDLDDLLWLPGWIQQEDSSIIEKLRKISLQESWIFSGNHPCLLKEIWRRCDMVVWLDYSLSLILYRGLKRTFRRIFFKEVCCNGNYEPFSILFTKYSIPFWILKSYSTRKKENSEFFEKLKNEHVQLVRISHPRELEAFLDLMKSKS